MFKPRIPFAAWAYLAVLTALSLGAAENKLPIITNVEWQPLAAQVRRLIEATDYLGSPLNDADKRALQSALQETDSAKALQAIQNILDPHCLVGVNINPEMRVKVAPGAAKPELVEQGWRLFLVKVQNEAGATAELRAVSPNAMSVFEGGSGSTASDKVYRKRLGDSARPTQAERWLDMQMFNNQPSKGATQWA